MSHHSQILDNDDHIHALTCIGDRFVDRDMFMRYRGGGIGHKYMRTIETAYENMSRERDHHKEQNRQVPRSGEETTTNADGIDGQGEVKPAGRSLDEGGQDRDAVADGNDEDADGNDDDYAPSSSDESFSSGISNSDDLDSEGDECYEEIHGFGDLS